VYCIECGKNVERQRKFCMYCGAPVQEAPSPQQPLATHHAGGDTGKAIKLGVETKAPSSKTKSSNHRTLIVVVIILVVCLLMSGGGYAVYHFLLKKGPSSGAMPTEGQSAKQHEVSQKAAAMYAEQVATKGDSVAVNATVEWLKKQEDVKDAGVGSGCIWGVYKDGTEFSIITTDPFMNK